jgi:two-component system response regulator VicR
MEKRILIVDSDLVLLDTLEKGLGLAGFKVNTSEATNDITSLVKHYKPHILVIAYILNGINGGELCRQVKKHPRTAKIPVILISAYPKILHSLGFYGCDAFIPKPFTVTQLTEKVTELLNDKPENKYATTEAKTH